MLIRLWLFTPRAGTYPEGGTYDTSVFDDQIGVCSDPHQEIYFEQLLQYANARGEMLQEVSSADEAYSICSPIRNGLAPCQGGSYQRGPMNAVLTRPPSLCFGGGAYYGAGSASRISEPLDVCPPEPNTVDPFTMSQPVVQTVSDRARRIIALARTKKIVPTINY